MTVPVQNMEGTPEEWDAGVAELQPTAQGGVALVGPCPRCSDTIRAPLDDLPLPAFGLHKHKQMVVRVICNCSTAVGVRRPASGGVVRRVVSRSSSDRVHLPQVVGPAPITDEQRAADQWVREGTQEALPRIRDLARQWGGTVTALTGLFSLGALASGDSAVRALTTGWRVVYALTGLSALTCAAAAITWAALAGQATVTVVSADVRDREQQRRSRVTRAVRQLHHSRLAAAVALVLGAAAVVVRWFAPTT